MICFLSLPSGYTQAIEMRLTLLARYIDRSGEATRCRQCKHMSFSEVVSRSLSLTCEDPRTPVEWWIRALSRQALPGWRDISGIQSVNHIVRTARCHGDMKDFLLGVLGAERVSCRVVSAVVGPYPSRVSALRGEILMEYHEKQQSRQIPDLITARRDWSCRMQDKR